MENMPGRRIHIPLPFAIMLVINIGFLAFAFVLESPARILEGFTQIILSRSILVSDYIAIGGISAALLNVSLVGLMSILMLILSGAKPNGATIMALWLTAGFAFFGKNVFNMLPLTFGVWLFAKYKKEPFTNYTLTSLLVATLSPVVSEMGFLGIFSFPVEVVIGVFLGFIIGFIFPPISAQMVRMHSGYDLYSMGFAGGLIATIIATVSNSMGFEIVPASHWSGGNNRILAAMLYVISAGLVCCGVFAGSFKNNFKGFLKFFDHSGRLITDFYFLYKNSVFLNMGILCAFATSLVLILGAELNGIVVAGILTIAGFGSFGKHLKNIIPVLAGAIISAYLNIWDLASPFNVAAILFSTALAPIAGQFGWGWGLVAGFLHVNVSMFVGDLNGGLNLYNNGFAAGFVAMFMLPLITISERFIKNHEDKV